MSNSKEILLESGTNELEIMEFTIAGNTFGINVAKVTEIMKYTAINPMPSSHPCVEGVFKPRENIITVIDLATYMGLPPNEESDRDMLIITGFNKMSIAFHVHTVEGILRISWEDIEKPDTTIYGGQEGLATGIAKVNGKLITIVDFEKVAFDISPQSGIQLSEIKDMEQRERNEKPILIAEDSTLLRKMIIEALSEAGYTNIESFNNGQDAWDRLSAIRQTNGNIFDQCALLITDIEMPKMDGHRLTKLVKDDPILQVIPVVIFSSLIDDTMRLKGEDLGANAQVTKPEIGKLVGVLDSLTS
ncbi:chemotaxis protein [Oscillospiraceae bacterium OttesenSCG-928-F05]|nr:chemotaxis protein [Oscillospiraceae bacterium OttesenSCG-928-F05]